MRDASVSPNIAEAAAEEADVFSDMKHCFLTNRSEETAVATLEKLLSMQSGEIDTDAWLEIKDLLSCLLETITVPNLVSRHQIIVLNAINHCPGVVVDFLADLIARNIEQLEDELGKSHIAIPIAFARRVTDSRCADSIAKFLWRFAHIEAVQNELKALVEDGDAEIRFRVHQVAASYLKEKGDGSKIAELVQFLVEEVSLPDILTQLTAIEMLSEIAYQNKAAAAYLYSLGLIDQMYRLLNTVAEQPDAGFLFPGVMKFFGHLSAADVNCLTRFPNFLRNMFDLVNQFDRLDASLRLLAFDTFAAVGSSDEAKRFLSSLSDADYDLEKALNMFGVAIGTGPLELRIRHLEALTLLLRPEQPIKEDVSEIIKKWWTNLGDGFPTMTITYLSRPFEQLRIAALQLLAEVLSYEWAIGVFKNVNGFFDALLDRRVETTLEGKQLKFNIVCLLIDTRSQLLPTETVMRLKLYRREGPYFVELAPQLDMEAN